MLIGGKNFETGKKTYVMGILNVTPDSFSDGGSCDTPKKALARAAQMVEEGADILDVGGESTRPGCEPVSEAEEIKRVIPVIKLIKSELNIPVSIDTYKSGTARAAAEVGADLINDIWGLRHDPDMASVIAESGLPCCLMHNRKEAVYADFMKEVIADLEESVHTAEKAGIAEDKIIIDPGVGFGKTYENNLEIMNCLEELHMFGYPLLFGASRKSVIGQALDLPVEERLEGTLVTTAIAVLKGCAFVRVHDVKANIRAIRMTEAVKRAGRNSF